MLTKIYNWFTEGFDTADLKEVRALLDELTGKAQANGAPPDSDCVSYKDAGGAMNRVRRRIRYQERHTPRATAGLE
jgi:hypothetical protein